MKFNVIYSQFTLFLILGTMSTFCLAQTQLNIEVGQRVWIKKCKPKHQNFEAIDVYARNTPIDLSKVDSLTGEGLMEAFFKSDIDAKRLPCSMGGFAYKIGSLQEVVREGKTVRVLLCYTKYPNTLLWIELDKAIELNEISFHP